MSDYYEDEGVTAPAQDPRIVAVHRLVEMEEQHNHIRREADRMAKKAAEVESMLRQAKDELSGLLGYPSNSGGVKAMSSEDAKAELMKRLAR